MIILLLLGYKEILKAANIFTCIVCVKGNTPLADSQSETNGRSVRSRRTLSPPFTDGLVARTIELY